MTIVIEFELLDVGSVGTYVLKDSRGPMIVHQMQFGEQRAEEGGGYFPSISILVFMNCGKVGEVRAMDGERTGFPALDVKRPQCRVIVIAVM